jgi:E3 ubiquitin-protein ligase RNF5
MLRCHSVDKGARCATGTARSTLISILRWPTPPITGQLAVVWSYAESPTRFVKVMADTGTSGGELSASGSDQRCIQGTVHEGGEPTQVTGTDLSAQRAALKVTTGAEAAGSVAVAGAGTDQPFDCSICFEVPFEDPVVTLCGHLFCWSCLHRWMTQHATCPVCKSLVDRERVIPLYGRGRDRGAASSAARQRHGKATLTDASVPPRPAARRIEPPPTSPNGALPPLRPGAERLGDWNTSTGSSGFVPYGTAGSISFTPFGLFPSIFGVQFTFPPQPPSGAPAAAAAATSRATMGEPNQYGTPFTAQTEDATQAMVSRMLLMLGMFVIMCLLLF